MSKIWVVNDHLTCIPGTKTFWHFLVEWFDAHWFGESYDTLAWAAERSIAEAASKPRLIIRNGSYFPWFTTCHRPVISIIQDIMPYHAHSRELQVNVGLNSDAVVFNSMYTAEHYPELAEKSVIIPLGVDFSLFKPDFMKDRVFDVCWVGASSAVKGWDHFMKIVTDNEDLKFACIAKDGAHFLAPNVTFFSRLTSEEIVGVYNSSKVGLCTSTQETQHLAGIEMAACGLSVVAPPVGVYHKLQALWARVSPRDSLVYCIRDQLKSKLSRPDVRQSVQSCGLDLESCRTAWTSLIERISNASGSDESVCS